MRAGIVDMLREWYVDKQVCGDKQLQKFLMFLIAQFLSPDNKFNSFCGEETVSISGGVLDLRFVCSFISTSQCLPNLAC